MAPCRCIERGNSTRRGSWGAGVVGMARINFEDDVEAQEEFWNLLPLVGGNRDLALGRLVRFFRIAQKAWGHNEPMTEDHLRAKGFSDMIESGWANPVPGGYHALGAAKHFGWYRQRVAAGESRAESERDEKGRFIAQRPTSETPAVDQRNSVPCQPLAPAPAPVPVLKKENIYIPPEQLKTCIQEWQKTLDRYRIQKSADLEAPKIASLIHRFGFELILQCLAGFRFEEKTKDFNPAKNVFLHRLEKPPNRERLSALGAQNQERPRELVEVRC